MNKVLGAYIYIAARLKEPSTHAALSSLLAMAGLNLDSGILHEILVALSVAFGAAGFFVKEAKPLTQL